MEFKILGPLEVVRGGHPVPISALKQRAVLAVLLIGANRVIPVDRLVHELWGDDPPAQAGTVLQGYVSSLRRILEPGRAPRSPGQVLVSRASGYALVTDPERYDSTRFQALAAQGHALLRAGQAEAAQQCLDASLVLWRGPALADFAYEPFAQPEAARLEELRGVTLEDRVECDLALGRHAAAVAELETMVGQRPLRERLWALLMLALYRAGRQSDALRTYERARRVLRDELGIDPGPGLRRLEADILAQDSSLDWRLSMLDSVPEPAPAPRPLSAEGSALTPPAHLAPPAPQPFGGRKPQMARLGELWQQAAAGSRRVAVVSGEPGAGKTRLACEMARTVASGGGLVLAGRCDEDLDVPYQPFVEALGHFVDITPDLEGRLGRHRRELVRLLPSLAERLPGLPPPVAADAETVRYRLFEAVAAWLAAASGAQPVLLVLDDLQWATRPTLLLLRHLVRSPEPLRLLVVAIHRDTDLERGHALVELLADLRREPGVAESVAVPGLQMDEIADLLAAGAWAGAVDDTDLRGRASAIHAVTGGNALLVGEMLDHSGAGDGREVRCVDVPEGVSAWVGRRLSRLSDEAHDVLVHAAAADDFDLDGLALSTHRRQEVVVGALEELISAGIVVDAGEGRGRYRYRHPLVRDAVFAGLSAARRAALTRHGPDGPTNSSP